MSLAYYIVLKAFYVKCSYIFKLCIVYFVFQMEHHQPHHVVDNLGHPPQEHPMNMVNVSDNVTNPDPQTELHQHQVPQESQELVHMSQSSPHDQQQEQQQQPEPPSNMPLPPSYRKILPNPWEVGNIQDFLHYCCPECDYKSKNVPSFQGHAVANHPMAKKFFSGEEVMIAPDPAVSLNFSNVHI